MTVFNHYARYFDLLYRDRNYAAEANYIDQLIQSYKPSSQSILELGCGTGLHAALWAKKQYLVHGVDQSKQMIKKALIRNANSSRLSFVQADVRDYRTDKKYDAIISIFHVVSYQTTNKDLLSTFETAQTHLKPGGIFIFDCWYGPAVLTDPPVVRVKRMEDNMTSVVRLAEPIAYPNQNCVDVNYTVWIRDKKTDEMEELKETHKMRYLFQPEIEQMLELSGLYLVNAQEWLSGEPLEFSTWNGCFIVGKK